MLWSLQVKFQQAAGIDADGTGAASSAWEEVKQNLTNVQRYTCLLVATHVLLHCSRPTVGSLTLLRLIQVEPGASLEYAWDEPQATRRLRCVLEDQAVTYRDAMHQYSLDEIRVSQQSTWQPVKLVWAQLAGRMPALHQQ